MGPFMKTVENVSSRKSIIRNWDKKVAHENPEITNRKEARKTVHYVFYLSYLLADPLSQKRRRWEKVEALDGRCLNANHLNQTERRWIAKGGDWTDI